MNGGGVSGFGFGRDGITSTAMVGQTIAHQYRIEVSYDGENFTIVVDKAANNVTKYVEFDEFSPTECRFVRLTITD